MKKILLIGTMSIMLSLTACGTKDLPSDKAIACAEEAIDIAYDYLDGNVSYDSAKESLDSISDDMSYVTDDSDKESNPNHSQDLYVEIGISGLKMDIMSDNLHGSDESRQAIEEEISYLEDLISK